jgi:hypothetical protein
MPGKELRLASEDRYVEVKQVQKNTKSEAIQGKKLEKNRVMEQALCKEGDDEVEFSGVNTEPAELNEESKYNEQRSPSNSNSSNNLSYSFGRSESSGFLNVLSGDDDDDIEMIEDLIPESEDR